jgi:hypothetical protein
MRRRCQSNRKATRGHAKTRVCHRHCGVADPMHVGKLHAREPTRGPLQGPRQDPVAVRGRKATERWEKAMSDKTHMNGGRESYNGIVLSKRSNESQGGPKEIVEGRPLTEENAEQSDPCRTQGHPPGPGKWARRAGTRTSGSKGRQSVKVHRTAASCQYRTAPQQLLRPEKERGGGCGRSDMAGIWRRTGGTDSGPPRTNSSRGIPCETVTKSLRFPLYGGLSTEVPPLWGPQH